MQSSGKVSLRMTFELKLKDQKELGMKRAESTFRQGTIGKGILRSSEQHDWSTEGEGTGLEVKEPRSHRAW